MAVAVVGNCLRGGCVMHLGYLYQTLESTHPLESLIGCQNLYISVPYGWEIAPDDSALLEVASTHNWGTSKIVGSGYWTTTMLWDGSGLPHNSSNAINESDAGVKPKFCNARILIRQLYLDKPCPRNETETPSQNCLPTISFVFSQISTPDFSAASEADGIIRFNLKATTLPLSLYLSHTVSYSLDIAPNKSSLNATGDACQGRWTSTISQGTTTFTVGLRYADLDAECQFSSTFTSNAITFRGILGFFATAAAGGPEGKETVVFRRWHFPIALTYPRHVNVSHANPIFSFPQDPDGGETWENMPGLPSTLRFYHSERFASEKGILAYNVGDVAFAELTLQGEEGDISSIVLDKLQLYDPSGEVVHNLVVIEHDAGDELRKVRFSAELHEVCVDCRLRLSAFVVDHRYEAGTPAAQQANWTFQQMLVSVMASAAAGPPSSNEGGMEVWFIVTIASGGVLAVLFSLGSCLLLMRCCRPSPVPPPPPPPPPPIVPGPDSPRPPPEIIYLAERQRIEVASVLERHELQDLFENPRKTRKAMFGAGLRAGAPDVRVRGEHNKLRVVEVWRVQMSSAHHGNFQNIKDLRRRDHERMSMTERLITLGWTPPRVESRLDELLPNLKTALALDQGSNETFLVHGTRMESLLDIVTAGLSARLSTGVFGTAAYLAEDVEKADQYSTPLRPIHRERADVLDASKTLREELFTKLEVKEPDDADIFFIVVCRAVLGFPAYTFGGDPDAGVPPKAMPDPPTETFLAPGSDVYVNDTKTELVPVPGIHPTVRYHSLILAKGGAVRRFREFLLFENFAIMPAYIVGYVRERS